jgi:hypothetical protein
MARRPGLANHMRGVCIKSHEYEAATKIYIGFGCRDVL